MIATWVINHIYRRFQHLITNLDHWWLESNSLEIYAAAISAKGSPLTRCWGFIDGKIETITFVKRTVANQAKLAEFPS